MPRCLLVILLVLTAAVSSAAAQSRSVRVVSQPSGAMVYVGDKDKGSVGVTPVMIKLPPGEHGLIIELAGYTRVVQNVVVPKGKGPAIDVQVTLTTSIGALTITGDRALGAVVTIDDTERGKVPLRVELEAGTHHVRVASEPPFEDFVEIVAGEDHTVVADPPPPPVAPPPPPPPPVPRGKPLVTGSVGFELGWRTFDYEGPDAPTTRTFHSGAVSAVRIDLELAPWRLAPAARKIWPLTLVFGGAFAPVADLAVEGETAPAELYWRTMDLGLRYRLALMRGRLAIGFEAGWTRNLYQFRVPTDNTVEDLLPDVDYQIIRFGARAEGRRGPLTGWLGLDNRVVVSAGVVADRYRTAAVDGFGLRLGGRARFLGERLEAGLELGLERYGWEFKPFPPPNMNVGPKHPATGGTDAFTSLRFWVGGSY